jgi:hypothetical protein
MAEGVVQTERVELHSIADRVEIAPGVILPFVHRPLSRYLNTLREVGLVLEHMDEPAPPAGFVARAPEYEAAATIPRLLALRLRRVG